MTMRTLKRTLVVVTIATCVGLSGCSRESRDWRSAQAADSLESYDHFLELHPDSELAAQARARLLQLTEERDWQRASSGDTADAYKQFLNQHPSGKYSAEARIRAENFALEGQPLNAAVSSSAPVMPARPAMAASSPSATTTVNAAAVNHSESTSAGSTASAGSASVSTGSNDFGIQLGAFSNEEKAQAEWQRLQGAFENELGPLRSHLVPVTTVAGNLFRLQAVVEDEARARAVCAALAEKSQACVVVLPQH
jgi:cell division septation protein DedD